MLQADSICCLCLHMCRSSCCILTASFCHWSSVKRSGKRVRRGHNNVHYWMTDTTESTGAFLTTAGWLQEATATGAAGPAGDGGAGSIWPVLRPLAVLRPAASGELPLARTVYVCPQIGAGSEREPASVCTTGSHRPPQEIQQVIRSCGCCSWAQRRPPAGAGAAVPLWAGPDACLLGAQRLGAVRCGRQVRV